MKNNWWIYPWVSYPIGFVLGFLGGLLSNWVWHIVHRKGKGTYYNISYSGDIMRFEGQEKVTDVNIRESLKNFIMSSSTKKKEK